MLVVVKPGFNVYREGHLRSDEDGVFRLYQTFEDLAYEDAEGKRHVPNEDEFLGRALRLATEHEAAEFEAKSDAGFEHEPAADDTDALLGRGAKIAMAVGQLEQKNDEHWTKEGLPACDAIEKLGNLVNVRRGEIDAVAPEVRRG